jgi:hypothetical protein
MKTFSRERVIKAINHIETESIPIDFGSTAVSGMHATIVEQLRKHYGLPQHPIYLYEPYQCLGLIEEDLREAIGIDAVAAGSPYNMFGMENCEWKLWETPWKQEVLVPGRFFHTYDEGGNVFVYPQGDGTVAASAKMPSNGYFFDAINRQQPLPDVDEDLVVDDNTEEFSKFSVDHLKKIESSVSQAYNTGKAVIASIGGSGLGDVALVPAMHLKNPKGIRDISEWYMSTVLRKDLIHNIFSFEIDVAIENLTMLNACCGDKIDALFTCGTDFGTQSGTFCSLETFRELYVPYYNRLNDWIHTHTTWRIFKHSCGSISKFIPDFIECGFDILNPVQCSAADMDPKMLKREFGSEITFWGGGVDTQKTLPFGTPEEVRKEVLERCEIFSKGGGFVFNAIHNVQARTPLENTIAMIEAVQEFNS